MRVLLDRIAPSPDHTVSDTYINSEYICNCLEDSDRGLRQDMPLKEILRIKIKGKTAIPKGIYKIGITYSPRWKKNMLEVLDVPGYKGIRIHAGNTADDTEGCLLFGKWTTTGRITASKKWSTEVTRRIEEALARGEEVTLEIK